MRKTKILVVDDEHLIRWSLEQNLKKQGYEVVSAGNGEDALRLVRDEQPDLVLLDIQLPGISGLDVLEKIKEHDEEIIVIMVTAHGALETAVHAMRLGAFDYINKPFNLDEMAIVIRKALETSDLRREVQRLRGEQAKKFGTPDIIGASRHMKNVLDMMEKVAKSDASTVLVQGESGTGKELVAKWIHYKSARAERPFVAINCAAVPATLLESELFGHEKGAFTDAKAMKKGLFELADGGTVFLDEIGDMELGMQAKLLRFLEERTFRRIGGTKSFSVDVRIISATNRDLIKAIEEKSFRNDLYYRLQVIPIYLPPLRERREDILTLTSHFIELFNAEFNKHVTGISKMAEKLLLDYTWPGNIRELKNVIERAIILGNDETLLLEHLPLEIVAKASSQSVGLTTFKLPPEGIDIEEVEKELIRQALEISDWNQSKAARKLNLGIDAFRYRMKKFGYLK
ncbi:two component, sigma54 specific, transcriptional regulator, Fis family [Geobacter metallireducens RCH3]|uniref:Sigma-54-dependent transcriptional response regulator n=1 Tax=Geobacter metallireducens (strain ATCC 53774 / DSM 7210 / GS-15) TaxID=269799 RepID=Q39Y76_GEOMG|nr:sigma-54 dependent transcriptional regulator [Geobacter metallireducens]ABB30798.1 sigma-54-dependent transcriptional response regulator [Geobacter metallireducens GS-15]EHP88210.1 two component, sigma54 specific, transcriptional regulator, Fis family [Geobacter metallireducens RCH3]